MRAPFGQMRASSAPCCSAIDVASSAYSASVDPRSRPIASKPIEAPIANDFLHISIEAIRRCDGPRATFDETEVNLWFTEKVSLAPIVASHPTSFEVLG